MCKEWIVSTVVVLGLLMGPVAANADIVIDTGPGNSNGGGTSLYSDQWLAMKFTTAQDYTITDIEGWMNLHGSGDGTATVAIYSGEGATAGAGAELFSTAETFTATVPSDPDWRGAAGLSWSLPAGTYWVSFEVRPGQGLDASMPDGAAPLDAYSFLSAGGSWNAGGFSNTGLRIMGDVGIVPPAPLTPATSVPTMSTYGLILTMLGLLLVAARRLRASAKRS